MHDRVTEATMFRSFHAARVHLPDALLCAAAAAYFLGFLAAVEAALGKLAY